MTPKPDHVFDRDREWRGLVGFAQDTSPYATLGVVSGRRRQGKSYLLEALTGATGGLYFPSIEATEAESLRLFATTLVEHTGRPVRRPWDNWGEAIREMLESITSPVPVVIDEFPFLIKQSPSLPSVIQRELGPGGSGKQSAARLLLCGSAMSVMGGLLAGQAPLRGRAGLELVVQPFGYRDAARFWDITDPTLAVLVHAIVGGTPAYRREFVRNRAPADRDDFDRWVIETVLDPQTPLFREARYLLAEETDIRDPGLYHAVLTAVALGRTTASSIANYIGRKADHVTHPLHVLEDSDLLARDADLLRSGRTTYRVKEPLVSFYHAVMRSRWAELERGQADAVWEQMRPTFLTQVVGPHFEQLAREHFARYSHELLDEPAGDVGAGVVNDAQQRSQIQLDIVAFSRPAPDGPPRLLAIGEVKWGETMGASHVDRLARARDLLAAKGHDVTDTRLVCCSAAGFEPSLVESSEHGPVILISLDDIFFMR